MNRPHTLSDLVALLGQLVASAQFPVEVECALESIRADVASQLQRDRASLAWCLEQDRLAALPTDDPEEQIARSIAKARGFGQEPLGGPAAARVAEQEKTLSLVHALSRLFHTSRLGEWPNGMPPQIPALLRMLSLGVGPVASEFEKFVGGDSDAADRIWALVRPAGSMSPSEATAPTERETERHTASLIWKGDFWTLTFEGTIRDLKNSVGLSYVAQLLAAPGRVFRSMELQQLCGRAAAAVDGNVAGESFDFASSPNPPLSCEDPQELGRLRKFRRDLEEARETLLDEHQDVSGIEAQMGDVDLKIDTLEASGNCSNDDDRSRAAVSKAIREFVSKLSENGMNRAAATHLRNRIKCGRTLSYDPEVGTSWRVVFPPV